MIRFMSVEWTTVVPRRLRRRLDFLPCSKWRLPALDRIILPPAVILNRLAADFFVLIPFGRRIISFKKSAQSRSMPTRTQAGIWNFLKVG